LSWRPMH